MSVEAVEDVTGGRRLSCARVAAAMAGAPIVLVMARATEEKRVKQQLIEAQRLTDAAARESASAVEPEAASE